jgi:hypothetical protein
MGSHGLNFAYHGRWLPDIPLRTVCHAWQGPVQLAWTARAWVEIMLSCRLRRLGRRREACQGLAEVMARSIAFVIPFVISIAPPERCHTMDGREQAVCSAEDWRRRTAVAEAVGASSGATLQVSSYELVRAVLDGCMGEQSHAISCSIQPPPSRSGGRLACNGNVISPRQRWH